VPKIQDKQNCTVQTLQILRWEQTSTTHNARCQRQKSAGRRWWEAMKTTSSKRRIFQTKMRLFGGAFRSYSVCVGQSPWRICLKYSWRMHQAYCPMSRKVRGEEGCCVRREGREKALHFHQGVTWRRRSLLEKEWKIPPRRWQRQSSLGRWDWHRIWRPRFSHFRCGTTQQCL